MPMTLRYCLLPLCIWAISGSAKAQPGDLTNDLPFFEKQTKVYQKWLNRSGLNASLSVTDIDVEPKKLYLYLAFPYADTDSIVSAWRNLKTSFEQERPLSLEQQLFYKMTHIMEVRQSMAEVHIYDTYDLRREPRFYRIIRFEQGRVTVEESNPQAQTTYLRLQPLDFSRMKKTSAEVFKKTYSRQAVFDKTFQYAQGYFENKVYNDRKPQVDVLENENVLRFEVMDLHPEVLTAAADPTLCRILRTLNHECDWVKREMLTFTIAYEEQVNGFKLSMAVDGKYGSGRYSSVQRGSYIDMETDFDEYLERYADSFKQELQRHLQQSEDYFQFPWPPPKASAREPLPKELLLDATTYADVDDVLTTALDSCGYFDKSYFSVPGGFALVVRMEQINKDATSKKPPERWRIKIKRKMRFSLEDYFNALLFGNPGYFRVIAFIISDVPVSTSSEKPSQKQVSDWVDNGPPALPYEIGHIRYTEKHNCTALIYEFELPESGEKAFLSSNHTGRDHLIKSNLWRTLLERR